jgi:hypothetical protein
MNAVDPPSLNTRRVFEAFSLIFLAKTSLRIGQY